VGTGDACQYARALLTADLTSVQVKERHEGFFTSVLRVECPSCLPGHDIALKVLRPELERKGVALGQHLFDNELNFFESGTQAADHVPKLLGSKVDETDPRLALNWVRGDHSQFISPEVAARCLDRYSSMQADWSRGVVALEPRRTEVHDGALDEVLEHALGILIDDFRAHDVPGDLEEVAGWIGENYTSAFGRVSERSRRFLHLVHGDLRADNLILSSSEVYFLDWQRWSVGWAALDVATLVTQSVVFFGTDDVLTMLSGAHRTCPNLGLPRDLVDWLDLVCVASFGPVVGYRLQGLSAREILFVRESSAAALHALSALLAHRR
jgi:Phosphotransferase enzyme family